MRYAHVYYAVAFRAHGARYRVAMAMHTNPVWSDLVLFPIQDSIIV
jgi:hypothetical protein